MEDYDKIAPRRRGRKVAPDRGSGICLHARSGSGGTSGYICRNNPGISPYDCK